MNKIKSLLVIIALLTTTIIYSQVPLPSIINTPKNFTLYNQINTTTHSTFTLSEVGLCKNINLGVNLLTSDKKLYKGVGIKAKLYTNQYFNVAVNYGINYYNKINNSFCLINDGKINDDITYVSNFWSYNFKAYEHYVYLCYKINCFNLYTGSYINYNNFKHDDLILGASGTYKTVTINAFLTKIVKSPTITLGVFYII